jgi:membrane protease YdiL (CAAX protease family)
LLAIGVVAGNWILVYALYFVFGEFKLRPSSLFSAPQNVTEFIALALVLGGAGFFEEIEYRGYILRQVLSLTGSKSFAIAVQAVLFAVAHGLDQTLVGLTAKFAFGWVLGEVAIRRRSLLPGMLAHSMNNLLALLLRVLL